MFEMCGLSGWVRAFAEVVSPEQPPAAAGAPHVHARPTYVQHVQLYCLPVLHRAAELYFRSPSVFCLPLGEHLTFAEVNESVRPFGETAIGCVCFLLGGERV